MKRKQTILAPVLGTLLLICAPFTPAAETVLYAGVNNFSLADDPDAPALQSNRFAWRAGVELHRELHEEWDLVLVSERHPDLGLLTHATIVLDFENLRIGFGPVYGLQPSLDRPLVGGISTILDLTSPDVGFVTANLAASVSSPALSTDTSFMSLDAEAGFFVPNARVSLAYRNKERTTEAADRIATRSLREYAGEAEVRRPGSPYGLDFGVAYQQRSRVWDPGTPVEDLHRLNSVVVRTGVHFLPLESWDFGIVADFDVLSFGSGELAGVRAHEQFLFDSTLQARYTPGD